MAYTTIDDPSAHFQTVIWTGNDSNPRTISHGGNSDMQPDWLWHKLRSGILSHMLYDSTRGVGKRLHSDQEVAEATQSDTGTITAFTSDGFTVDAGTTNDLYVNDGSRTYVSWGWKANGGTTSSNTEGDITSTVQANTTAGFSIVSWAGQTATNPTIGHGLSTAPTLVITKNRTSGNNWLTGVTESGFNWNTDYYHLNSTNAKQTNAGGTGFYRAPTSTTISSGGFNHEETSSNYIAYCFHSVQGYSRIGKYIGNGSTNGTFVYTGFKPAWLIVKGISANNREWFIFDGTRNPANPFNKYVKAESTDAEASSNFGDFCSNGFKVRSDGASYNASGETFIYMAFAEHPFVSSKGVPTTAR